MHLFDIRVFEQQDATIRQVKTQTGNRLRALAAAMLTLAAGVPSALRSRLRQPSQPIRRASALPAAPTPTETVPV